MNRVEAWKIMVDNIVDVLDLEEDEVKVEANFKEDFEIDSLGIVELMLAIEEAFDLDIADEEAEGIATVGQSFELVCSKLGI